jgi:hypothetical protein
MNENGTHTESLECSQFPEAVRLLWEGTRKAVDAGIDTDDLVVLCNIMVRLADHRLLFLGQFAPSRGCEEAAGLLQHYRKMASELLQWAAAPTPEPDWADIEERLQSVGAASLEFQGHPKE